MATNVLVWVRDGDVARALKDLKKHMIKSGTQRDMKRHDYYLKPSFALRLKSKVARSKARKAAKRVAEAMAARERHEGG
jgi:ribosomal protein S21